MQTRLLELPQEEHKNRVIMHISCKKNNNLLMKNTDGQQFHKHQQREQSTLSSIQ
jgi:hypothetical protein